MYSDFSEKNFTSYEPKIVKERLIGYLVWLAEQQHNHHCYCACQGRGCPVFEGAERKYCTCFDLFFESILDMEELGVLRKILEAKGE